MRDGAVAGFKYFKIKERTTISVETSGTGKGTMLVSDIPDFSRICAELSIAPDISWEAGLSLEAGVHALYFKFEGIGSVNFHTFELKT